MPNTLKPIEKKWIKSFSKCPLVDTQTNSFNCDYARQLFYGRILADYPSEYPENCRAFFSNCNEMDRERAIEKITELLEFIGIVIDQQRILDHVQHFPADFAKLSTKCFY